MKNFQKFISIILLTLFSFSTLSFTVFSQTKSLPNGLDKDSTFEEIVDWLNKNSFPKATVGMEWMETTIMSRTIFPIMEPRILKKQFLHRDSNLITVEPAKDWI